MGKCITCKHWAAPFSTTDRFRRCEKIDACKPFSDIEKQPVNVRAITEGDDRSAFMTTAYFGCTLYEIHPVLGPPGSVATISEN